MNGETPDVGKPHIRFDEEGIALAKPSRRSLLYKRMATIALCLFPLLASADIFYIEPLPGEMPLHRIGYEIFFEFLAASAAGAAAVRALVKRRWKIRDELSPEERDEFGLKIDAVLPQLVDEVIKVYQDRRKERKDFITRQISENPELKIFILAGVPIDAICDEFSPDFRYLDEVRAEREYGQEIADKLQRFERRLSRVVSEAGFYIRFDHKTLLESALARNDELRQALDGVPIELINESIVSRLPPEIEVKEGPHSIEGDGFLWMTSEDEREIYERHRSHHESPTFPAVKRVIEEAEEKEKRRVLVRLRRAWQSLLKFVTTG